jgi:glycerol-3-phosphate cytidylyltransferase/D-beta-D-heptose 7-phosphate kinase/D-beta-D-heptose 1-phosphate adenosyltransferase
MNICIVSGYFNPIHPGHISMMQEIKLEYPNCLLIAIVNNDHQVKLKKSVPFLDEVARCYIVQHIQYVDQAFLSIDQDTSILQSLSSIHNHMMLTCSSSTKGCNFYFFNGGDRDPNSACTPEVEFCNAHNIHLKYGYGDSKTYSSRDLIEKACGYILAK